MSFIMALSDLQIFLLVYLVCTLCHLCTSQKEKFGLENRAALLMFTEENGQALNMLNSTLNPSSMHSHFRQRRSAANFPMDIAGDGGPSDVVALQRGDVVLGGMFAVLLPDDEGNPCSKVLHKTGLRMEAMMYAVDVLNNNTDILPDVKLGFEIRNDCSNPNQALTEALNFISVNDGESCSSDEPQTIGVVGTGSSATSTDVANLLGLFKVPQVSYSASSRVLSNKKLYPYFLRTIASDVNQAEVMADLAETMGWNYVAIIYTIDNYGTPGVELLSDLLQARNVCVTHTLGLNSDSPDDAVIDIIQQLSRDEKISVIFTFCGKQGIGRILAQAQASGFTNRTWIASDSWGQSDQVVQNVKSLVRGMLGIIPKSRPDENFKRYLSRLDPYSNHRNPWYQLTLGELRDCSFDPTDTQREQCMGNETFADQEDAAASFVIDAVYALGYGLHNMLTQCDDCLNGTQTLDLEVYLDYVKRVNFSGLTNSNFMFDENGDPIGQYDIYNLQCHGDECSFVKVADWDPISKFSNWQEVEWQTGRAPPLSRCSEDCPAGHFITLQTPKCCWECHRCEAGSISVAQNSLQCTVCRDGERTNENQTSCLVNPIVYLEWDNAVAIVLVILTVLGLLATGFTLAVYIRHRNSATIKATSTELSYLLLVGIAMSYASTFLFIAMPTDEICNAKIVMVGISFAVYVGALLTKTNRISRIFNRKLSDGAPSMFLNIQYQLLFALGIVVIQIAIQVVWLQLEPGVVVKDTSDPEVTLLQCNYNSVLGPAVAVGFNAVLATLCLYKAFRTRKLPGQFNDSRGICFAMLTCCLIWFVFLVCYFATTGIANSIICSTAFIASGTSGLICMFAPKMWIVIARPELNVRQSTLKLKSSSGTGVNIKSVSSIVDKKNGRASLTPIVSDPSPASSHSSDGDRDSTSQVSSEDEEQRFLEELEKLEEELKDAVMERDDAVAKANESYQEMLNLQKMQDEELEQLDEAVRLEKANLRRLLISEGMKDEDIDRALRCQDEEWTDNEDGDNTLKVAELVAKLASVSAERDKLNQQVEQLSHECQQWKNIIIKDPDVSPEGAVNETSVNNEGTGSSSDISTCTTSV
ncbi:metabotropic glutamate receptor 3-like [Patiria miniata]|uniref:G-protein coupled receptors family 3 profile domain-containing protein n=1 Tax=Patiria miniata TaxID=46514 RepID=A0A913ZGW6_PATMI|nr:metabotropic glutamate receptor 3-like [Patiria miniata]